MNEQEAKRILKDYLHKDGDLYSAGRYLAWRCGNEEATLDGSFDATELEAIAWWMRNVKQKKIK